mgnify:CR=1 FL=1
MNLELDQKQVIVTGGSKGIGLAIALNFAREGGELLLIVVLEGVGLNVHGLVTVRFFGVSACRRVDGGQTTEQEEEVNFHKGANLA